MQANVIFSMLSEKDRKRRLKFQLVTQCAPFLKGLKPACAVNLEKMDCKELEDIFEGTDVAYRILDRRAGRGLVFFYRRAELEEYIRRKETAEFLKSYGYETGNIEQVLSRLCERTHRYSDGELSFPHEMGALLGYPAGDVKGFIDEKGKHFLFSGYWKVYQRPERAQRLFCIYDKAKVCAVNEFLSGAAIREIACKTISWYTDIQVNE